MRYEHKHMCMARTHTFHKTHVRAIIIDIFSVHTMRIPYSCNDFAGGRAVVHEYHHHHNMAAQYGSLLLPPPTSRLAPPPPPPPPPTSHPHPHQYHSKGGMEPWPNSAHHPALDTGASYSSYPTVPGNLIA